MPVDYEIDNKLKALAPVVDDHAEWFGRMTKRIFFASEYKDKDGLAAPGSFLKWSENPENYDFIEETTFQDLKKLYEELHVVATGLINKAAAGDEQVTFKEYDAYTGLYESFILKLRRIEQDCAMVGSGLDFESGLRSKQAMEIDIKRELDRLARRGSPFVLAVARIDHYDVLSEKMDDDSRIQVLSTLGQLIKKCVRSFDDAYRSGPDEFIMCLKQSEASGGTTAVNRLREFLADQNLMIKHNDGEARLLTMSYCVAEPIAGDTLEELLENMRCDLDSWEEKTDTAVEYQEQSPLQRYIGESE